jgi:hypothetical protein
MKPSSLIVGFAVIAGAAQLAHADAEQAPKFKLRGETLHVLPVDLSKSVWGKGQPGADANPAPARYGNAFAMLLTRAGAKGVGTDASFKVSNIDDDAGVARELSEVVRKNENKANFTVFLSIESEDQLKRIRVWLLDKEGRELWKGDETGFAKGRPVNPLSTMVFASGMLGLVSDLEDPSRKSPAPKKATEAPAEGTPDTPDGEKTPKPAPEKKENE